MLGFEQRDNGGAESPAGFHFAGENGDGGDGCSGFAFLVECIGEEEDSEFSVLGVLLLHSLCEVLTVSDFVFSRSRMEEDRSFGHRNRRRSHHLQRRTRSR